MTTENTAPPAGAAPPAGSTPPAGATPPADSPPARPEYVPEQFWDGNAVKPEFATHYSELADFHKTTTEAQAALKARKPEDIKFEFKLPDSVKLPEGMELKVDEKDPRVPLIRQLAVEHGLDQEVVNKLVALDAQQKIEAHTAEMARVQAEDAKLGAQGKDRKAAVAAWVSGFKDLSADERAEIGVLTATAAGVTLLEKIIAKANGSVPGNGGNAPPPPKPADVPITTRWYGASQQKVS